MSRSIAENEVLTSALAGLPPINTGFPDTELGRQLAMISKLIAARGNLGMRRQIFFCAVGGYDTHGDQLASQSGLLAELSAGMNAFYSATQELGVAQSVTTFTAWTSAAPYPPMAVGATTDGGAI